MTSNILDPQQLFRYPDSVIYPWNNTYKSLALYPFLKSKTYVLQWVRVNLVFYKPMLIVRKKWKLKSKEHVFSDNFPSGFATKSAINYIPIGLDMKPISRHWLFDCMRLNSSVSKMPLSVPSTTSSVVLLCHITHVAVRSKTMR